MPQKLLDHSLFCGHVAHHVASVVAVFMTANVACAVAGFVAVAYHVASIAGVVIAVYVALATYVKAMAP